MRVCRVRGLHAAQQTRERKVYEQLLPPPVGTSFLHAFSMPSYLVAYDIRKH